MTTVRGQPVPAATLLVGRDREMAELSRELDLAARQGFRCVLLLGDPGLGKTRLVSEFLARNRDRSLSLSARAYPLGATASFGLWAEALDRHLRHLAPEDATELCGVFAGDLGGLLRSLRRPASVPEPGRGPILEGLATVLANLAAERPTVVALDDVHWADASSWQALSHFGRTLVDRPILVVIAARPQELAEATDTAEVVLGLEQEGVLRRLEVLPLDAAGIRQLAEATLGIDPAPSLVEWLVDRSRGNPLFAVGLLRALADQGADLAHPELAQVPESLAERVRAGLRRLDEPALATLEVLSLLGRVELTELIHLSGRPLDRLARILEVLVRARLVVEEQQEHEISYQVAHPLVQQTIYDDIGRARRRALHRQVARALLAMGRLGAAAPHFARSADSGDTEAVAALQDAYREAEARQAYREAFQILRALLELLPPGDERWLDVVDVMAPDPEWVLDHRVDLDASTGIEMLRRADALLTGSGDLERRAAVQFRLAHFLGWGVGDTEQALASGTRARQLFEESGRVRSALLAAIEVSYLIWMEGDTGQAQATAGQVLSQAESSGDRFVLVEALSWRGVNLDWAGRFRDAEAAYRRAIDLARAEGRSYRLSWNLLHLAVNLAHQGRGDEALAAVIEARPVYAPVRETIVTFAAWAHWVRGDFAAAVASGRELMTWHRAGIPHRHSVPALFAAMAAAEAGHLDEARLWLERTHQRDRWLFPGTPSLAAWAVATGVLHGDGPAAAAPGLAAAARGLLDGGAPLWAPFALVDWAEAAAGSGDADGAAEAFESLAALVPSIDGGPYSALAGLAGAWAALAAGDEERAAGLATAAAEALAAWPAYQGRGFVLAARAAARADRPLAVRALERAVEIFEWCGARPRRDAALDALRGLGTRGRRSAAAALGPQALSDREREVARLATQGLTAREISDRLFIGVRTVETHLANAYAKLGVASKRELARRAAEFGL